MGIFKSIRKLFSNDIEPDVAKLSDIVCPYAVKGGKIKLNSTLFVPEGYVCVFGANGKSLDCFKSGKVKLTVPTLNYCAKRFKLNKQNKKGEYKKTFKADVYFVNEKDFIFDWKTVEKAELGKRATGIFTVGAVGKVKVRCNEPEKLIEQLLNEYAYLKPGEPTKIIKVWLGDIVVRILNKYNFALSEFFNEKDMIKKIINEQTNIMLNKFGLRSEDMVVDDFVLPKKTIKLYEKSKETNTIEKNNIPLGEIDDEKINNVSVKTVTENNSSLWEDVEVIADSKNNSSAKNENERYSEFSNSTSEEYIPFGTFTIGKTDEQSVLNQVSRVSNSYIEDDSNVEFVDLNIDNLLNNNGPRKKRCLSCGAENDINAEKCILCGEKL